MRSSKRGGKPTGKEARRTHVPKFGSGNLLGRSKTQKWRKRILQRGVAIGVLVAGLLGSRLNRKIVSDCLFVENDDGM